MKWEDKIGGLNSKYVENWFLCQTKYCSPLSFPSKMCDILACVTYWWVCVIVYYIGGHVWYIGGDGKRENMFWEIQHEMPPPLFKVNSITWIYGFQYHTFAIFPMFTVFTGDMDFSVIFSGLSCFFFSVILFEYLGDFFGFLGESFWISRNPFPQCWKSTPTFDCCSLL